MFSAFSRKKKVAPQVSGLSNVVSAPAMQSVLVSAVSTAWMTTSAHLSALFDNGDADKAIDEVKEDGYAGLDNYKREELSVILNRAVQVLSDTQLRIMIAKTIAATEPPAVPEEKTEPQDGENG